MKSGSALFPVIAVCWSEGDQENACNQTVCGQDTLDLQLESWSGEQFPMTAGALVVVPNTPIPNLYVTLIIQLIVLIFMNNIQEGVLKQDNAHLHTTVVTQRLLYSVDMLPLPATSSNLSPTDIVGRQFQHHPQPALTILVLTQ
ncbi:phospholipid-transporting ATPase [Trichonephila clavipes]|nr:phospholipid-transporting ATPase [Trichonephila clavipes]